MNRSSFYSIIHLSLSFILIFTSYSVAQTFQTSSIYPRDGALAVGILYLAFCIANLGLSSLTTQLLGPRLTLILSSVTYVSFIAANIKYNRWALYITAVILGVGAALLWTAQGVYVTISTNRHERINNLIASSTRGLMNGMFFGLFQIHQIIGNLLAAFLFRLSLEQWVIFTIMTVIAGLGATSLVCLSSVRMQDPGTTKQSILSSLSILVDVRFVLLIPLMCYSGLSQGFIFGAVPPLIFDKSHKFFIFAIFGIVNACSCIIFGKLSDLIGRRFLILVIGVFAHMVIFVLLLTTWKPPFAQTRNDIFMLLVFCLGVGDAIFNTLLYSIVAVFYGDTRPADAFSSLKIFQAGFTAIGFIEQVYVKPHAQVLILMILLLITFITFTYEHLNIASFDTNKNETSTENRHGIELDVEGKTGTALPLEALPITMKDSPN